MFLYLEFLAIPPNPTKNEAPIQKAQKDFFFFYWLTRATLVSKDQTKEHILKETQMTVGASVQQVISLHPLGEKKKISNVSVSMSEQLTIFWIQGDT